MATTRFRFRPEFFSDRPLELVSLGELTVTVFKYESRHPRAARRELPLVDGGAPVLWHAGVVP